MAELHNRIALESKFAVRLSRLSSKHRRELVKLMGNPPDIARVPPKFWEKVERETEAALALLLLLLFGESARQHGASRSIIGDTAEMWAQRRAQFVASSYTATSQERAANFAARLDSPSTTLKSINAEALKVFGPERSANIAVSETTKAASAGAEEAIGATVGFSEQDTWFTREDRRVCPVCYPLHRTPRSVWSARYPGGPGPEVHPGCRCYIEYASEKRPAKKTSPRRKKFAK
jgi:hypothetical protein